MSELSSTSRFRIAPMLPDDWPRARDIYLEGIATGNATFETEAPAWPQWDETHLSSCRLVAYDGQTIIGWAALSAVSHRCVYAGVAEVSVYVAESHRGRGAGQALMQSLVNCSEQNGIWTLQAVVFPENSATIRLHEAWGFRIVGRRHRIAQLGGVWRDTVLLERRSEQIGFD